MSSFSTSLCNRSQLTSELDSSLVMLMRNKDLFVVCVLIRTLFSETVMDSPLILLKTCTHTRYIKVMHVCEPGLKTSSICYEFIYSKSSASWSHLGLRAVNVLWECETRLKPDRHSETNKPGVWSLASFQQLIHSHCMAKQLALIWLINTTVTCYMVREFLIQFLIYFIQGVLGVFFFNKGMF